MLDLIGRSEGTDKGRGYNETLGYGAYTRGPVNLTEMTLEQVRGLQRQMLANPANRFHSSALGRYQIVGSTMEGLIREMGLDPRTTKFTPEVQDAMAVRLMQRRGLGSVTDDPRSQANFMRAASREWASLPDPTTGRGAYAGQSAHVTREQVAAALRGVSPAGRPPAAVRMAAAEPVSPVQPIATPGASALPSRAGAAAGGHDVSPAIIPPASDQGTDPGVHPAMDTVAPPPLGATQVDTGAPPPLTLPAGRRGGAGGEEGGKSVGDISMPINVTVNANQSGGANGGDLSPQEVARIARLEVQRAGHQQMAELRRMLHD
jgi:muramidase (phage lysozyme)